MRRLYSTYMALITGTALLFGSSCIKNHSFPPQVCNVQQVGPLYSAVKSLINNRCVGCHNGTVANGGENFTLDCNILNAKGNIKLQAVDLEAMPPGGPPLSVSEKKIITDWISAGGTFEK